MDSARRKRRSTVGRSSVDLVALFPHNRPKRVSELTLEEHTTRDKSKVYTVTAETGTSNCIVEMGKDVEEPAEGMDYAIAIVNKETGETFFRPATLLSFEAVYSKNVDEVLGKKKKSAVDYAQSFEMKSDQWAEKRNALTQQFAGTKKLRMFEAQQRRQINTDTLEEMSKTAFASDRVLLEMDKDNKDDISLVNKAQSSILPKFVDCELAKDVYPLHLFITDDEISAVVSDCRALWKKGQKEAIEAGIPDFIYSIAAGAVRDDSIVVGYTLLSAMATAIAKCHRFNLRRGDWEDIKLPEAIMTKVKIDYLPDEFRAIKTRDTERFHQMSISAPTKERLMSHALALATSLAPSQTIPLTPWAKLTAFTEAKIVKLCQAIGCGILNLTAADAIKFGSIRAARLFGPPNQDKSGNGSGRKFLRRRTK